MAARHAARAARSKNTPRFKVGDRIRFAMGVRRASGVIVEDRGLIGVGGRRLYSIRMRVVASDDLVFELPEDDLRSA